MTARPPRYRVLDHTADSAVQVRGETREQVFENAAFAMFDLTFDLAGVVPQVHHRVEAVGDTVTEVLVAWLSELLAIAEIEDLAFTSFLVEAAGERAMLGWASGAAATGLELRGSPIKAVTHHDAEVSYDGACWWAQLIFDV